MQGGLGNQLFQYATAYSYAKKYKRKIIINLDSYAGYQWNKDAGFVINKIIKDLIISKPTFWTIFFKNEKYLKILNKIIKKMFWLKGQVFIEKKGFSFDPQLFENDNWDGMIGFFQSSKYFESFEKDIIKIFQFPIQSSNIIKYKKLIENSDCPVSIHYRDYGHLHSGNEQIKKEFGDISIEYYNKAMEKINKTNKKSTYFIFSNSIKSAKEKFADLNNVIFVDFKSEYEWEDLVLMSLCHHNIICNSSYSWWSAYLNEYTNKMVIAPKNWGEKLSNSQNNNDLFLKEWILI